MRTRQQSRNSANASSQHTDDDQDTLAEAPKKMPKQFDAAPKSGFRKDADKIVLLVVLYLLQGIPLGLAMGSVPFLLKKKMTFSQMATFSLASYPYSLKLLWSPIVDSIYFKSFGRRKSWIIPIQLLVGSFLWYIGTFIDDTLSNVTDDDSIVGVTFIFVSLVFLAATQDIAVDGWALTLLSEENLSYASTCQTIGLNTGYFLSFTVFLALHSSHFCNMFLRSVPLEFGILALGSYVQFWALCFFAVTVYLLLFVHEVEEIGHDGHGDMKSAYMDIVKVLKLREMQVFIGVLLLAKIGFIANDNVTAFKLIEKGIQEEELGLTALINFPLQIVFGYYAAKWSQGAKRLNPWLKAFYGRLAVAILAMIVVYYTPNPITTPYFILIVVVSVISSFASTVQFVSMGAFFATIADPSIGGTYMTLLNTLSNFGGTYPQYFVLRAVDFFTVAGCTPDEKASFSDSFECSTKKAKLECGNMGGHCEISQDGYYIVSTISVIIGTALLLWYIKPRVMHLERLSPDKWKVSTRRSKQ